MQAQDPLLAEASWVRRQVEAHRAGSRYNGPGEGMRRWWRPRLSRTLKDLDDDHTTAAAGAWQRRIWHRSIADRRWCGHSKQLPSTRNIGLAACAGEEAVVTDAVEALWKNVEHQRPLKFSLLPLNAPQLANAFSREAGSCMGAQLT